MDLVQSQVCRTITVACFAAEPAPGVNGLSLPKLVTLAMSVHVLGSVGLRWRTVADRVSAAGHAPLRLAQL